MANWLWLGVGTGVASVPLLEATTGTVLAAPPGVGVEPVLALWPDTGVGPEVPPPWLGAGLGVGVYEALGLGAAERLRVGTGTGVLTSG
jgi:hypothetical protein